MDFVTFFLFLTVTVILGVCLVGVVFYYQKLNERYTKLQKENAFLKVNVQQKSIEKVNGANSRALEIIQNATQQADEIIKKTKTVEAETSETFKKELEALTQKQQQAFAQTSAAMTDTMQKTIKDIASEDISILKNTSNNINEVAVQEVNTFQKTLADHTITAEQAVDAKVQEAFQKALHDVEVYKKEKIDKVDAILLQMTSDAAKDLLGKRLSFEEQKELVMASLEKIKTDVSATTV